MYLNNMPHKVTLPRRCQNLPHFYRHMLLPRLKALLNVLLPRRCIYWVHPFSS